MSTLVYPFPFPSEVAKDPVEMFRYARSVFGRDQKWRAGQFSWSGTVTANSIKITTFVDPSAGGADVGFDNLVAGMWVSVSPPVGISANLQVGYALSPAAGKLTVQLINGTAGDIPFSGTWSFVGYTF